MAFWVGGYWLEIAVHAPHSATWMLSEVEVSEIVGVKVSWWACGVGEGSAKPL